MTTRVAINPAWIPHCDPSIPKVDAEVPEGYIRVWQGKVLEGDLFLNNRLARNDIWEWLPCYPKHLTDDEVGWFLAVIRKGTEDVGKPCVRCLAEGRFLDYKYCRMCVEAHDALTWTPSRAPA